VRILYHQRTRGEDAQGIHIQEMVRAFRKLGHEVEVVGIVAPGGEEKGNGIGNWISSFAAKMPPLAYELLEIIYNIYGIYALSRKVKNFKPDFLYERYALYNFSGVAVAKLHRIPLILEVNAPLAIEKQTHSRIAMPTVARAFEKWICSNSHKTIVVSTPLKRILEGQGVAASKLVVIPNGIDPEMFNTSVSGQEVRKELGIDDKIVLGFVGWFRRWHGLEELLRIYVKCDMRQEGIHLLLVGDGPALNDLVNYAKKQGILGNGVMFTGAVQRDEVPRYIAAFDLALQPDVTEYASPIKLFEYMAMGKGVITPDKENIREIVTDEYGGLYRAGDLNDMAVTILRLASQRNGRRALNEQSKQIMYERKYFWEENARRTLRLLRY